MKKDWAGKIPKPDYYMESYNYAWDYIKAFNKKPRELNDKYEKQGLGNHLKLRILNIVFWMDIDLTKDNALGNYTAEGIASHASPTGLIKIDIRQHRSNFEKIKETIRHEIAHAIAHQINGCAHNGHNNTWRKIAEEHKVNIDHYKAELS